MFILTHLCFLFQLLGENVFSFHGVFDLHSFEMLHLYNIMICYEIMYVCVT